MRLFPKIICIGTSFYLSKGIFRYIFSNYANDICKNVSHAISSDTTTTIAIYSMAIVSTYVFSKKIDDIN
jgi:hypothetical protein